MTPSVPSLVPNLQPGEQQTATFVATLNGLMAGESYIDTWIDSGPPGPFNEKNFANNVQSIEINYIDGKDPEVTYLGLQNPFVKTGVANTLVYTATDNIGIKTVDFYYSTDDGVTWTPIFEGYVPPTPPTYGAMYAWTIPSHLPAGGNLTIRTVVRDSSGNWGERTAGPYNIKSGAVPSITVLSPNGGEVWDMASQHQIQWSLSAANSIQEIAIYFYYGNTADYVTTISSPTVSSYLWSLRDNFSTTTGRIRLRVVDVSGNEAEDWSDGFFTIRDNSIGPPPPWGTPTQLTSTAGGDPGGKPRVVTDSAGIVHLIYGLVHDANAHTVTFRYKKSAGESWAAPTLVALDVQAVDHEIGASYSIADWNFAVDSQWHPHLVWSIGFPSFPESNKNDVFYSSFNGAGWSSPENLSGSLEGSFDVNTLSWVSRQSMPFAQANCASAVLNGKLYILGGGAYLRVYEYTPGSDSWSRKSDAPTALDNGGAAAVSGKIYVVSPNAMSTPIYDPMIDSWTTTTRVSTPRTGVAVAAVGERIYAIGGLNSAKNEMLDPGAGSWTARPEMPTARGWAAAAVVDNMIYVIGGRASDGSDLSTIEVYDPTTETWSTRARPIGASWPTKEGAVASVVNNRIYLLGGRNWNSYLTTVDEYDPSSNSWVPMNPLQGARAYFGGGAIGSDLYVAGGTEFNGAFPNTLSTVEKASISSTVVGAVSRSPVIAIDPENKCHVLWEDGTSWQGDGDSTTGFTQLGENNLYHRARSAGGQWSPIEQVTTSRAYGPAVAANNSGDVHLVFFTESSATYVRKTGDSWSLPAVISSSADDSLDIACGTGSSLHVAWLYWNWSIGKTELRYSHFDGQSWSPYDVVHATGQAWNPSIIADNLDRPHVIWENTEWPARLWHSLRIGGMWLNPVQLNLDSQIADWDSGDAAFTGNNSRIHAVWSSSVNNVAEVMYNSADVSFTTDAFPPLVLVTAPTPGGVRSVGSSLTIQWTASDNVGVAAVDLHYSADAGVGWSPISLGEPNSGSFAWSLPNVLTDTFQIRVTAHDAAGNSTAGYSGTFSVADLDGPTIVLNAPAGASTLTGNASAAIEWTAIDNVEIAGINLEYSLNSGTTWIEIAVALDNSGSYSWKVPNTPTSALLIRATARDAAGFTSSVTSTEPLVIAKQNTQPTAPHSPFPTLLAQGIPPGPAVLQWSGGDVDGDALTYEIRFGTDPSPPVLASAVSGPTVNLASLTARDTRSLRLSALSGSSQKDPGRLHPLTTYYWQVTASDGLASTEGPVWSFTTSASSVLGRQVFYNNSAFDGNDPTPNASDDGAVATDKVALLPGQAATLNNYTSYSKGLNGIMVDIAGLGGTLTADDFSFKVGNNNEPAGWASAPPLSQPITVRSGAGIDGSDRVTLIWADNAIQKQWLQVTVKASANTGLSADDLFYFGNSVGDTGNSATDALVTFLEDELGTRANFTSPFTQADTHNRYDFDRDGDVDLFDQLVVRANLNGPFDPGLQLIDLSGGDGGVGNLSPSVPNMGSAKLGVPPPLAGILQTLLLNFDTEATVSGQVRVHTLSPFSPAQLVIEVSAASDQTLVLWGAQSLDHSQWQPQWEIEPVIQVGPVASRWLWIVGSSNDAQFFQVRLFSKTEPDLGLRH